MSIKPYTYIGSRNSIYQEINDKAHICCCFSRHVELMKCVYISKFIMDIKFKSELRYGIRKLINKIVTILHVAIEINFLLEID